MNSYYFQSYLLQVKQGTLVILKLLLNKRINPLMTGVKKGHTYLNKAAATTCRVFQVRMTFCYREPLKG